MADKENPARGATRGGVMKEDCSPARTAAEEIAPAVCPRNGAASSPAARLTAALGGTWQDQVGRADCPVHQGPGLRIIDGDRATLVFCGRGCNRRLIIGIFRARGLWGRA
jgi:hypothetical protein